MALTASVVSKVRRAFPSTSDRWSDDHIGHLIYLADCAVREEGQTLWAHTDIALQDEAMYYNLPAGTIAVSHVEFSLDGTTFDDGVLEPTTFSRLDELNSTWIDDRGTQPHHYLLLSAPGVEEYSKIMIWRPITAVTAEKIRVHYLSCYGDDNLTFTTAMATVDDEDAEDLVYLPYVKSLLWAEMDPQKAVACFAEYRDGIAKLRERTSARMREPWAHARGSGIQMGQYEL